MALIAATADAVLLGRVRQLRQQAAQHKSEAGRHRRALVRTMSDLSALLTLCRERGLDLGEAKEESHGQSEESSRSLPQHGH